MDKKMLKEILETNIFRHSGFWIPYSSPVRCRMCENYYDKKVMTKKDVCINCFILNLMNISYEEGKKSSQNKGETK